MHPNGHDTHSNDNGGVAAPHRNRRFQCPKSGRATKPKPTPAETQRIEMSTHRLCVRINVQRITCPGVYLCSRSSECELTLSALGTHAKTARLPPSFPLLIHHTFDLEHTLRSGGGDSPPLTMAAIEEFVFNEPVHLTLWQYSRRLADLRVALGQIMCPGGQQELHDGVPVPAKPLLMQASRYFPGSITPMMEVQAVADLEARCRCCGECTRVPVVAPAPRRRLDELARRSVPRTVRRHHHHGGGGGGGGGIEDAEGAAPQTKQLDCMQATYKPQGMRQWLVCHSKDDDQGGDGSQALKASDSSTSSSGLSASASASSSTGSVLESEFICNRCVDQCSWRCAVPPMMGGGSMPMGAPMTATASAMREVPQSLHNHGGATDASRQLARLYDPAADISLLLQLIHPKECRACAEYRKYFGKVVV